MEPCNVEIHIIKYTCMEPLHLNQGARLQNKKIYLSYFIIIYLLTYVLGQFPFCFCGSCHSSDLITSPFKLILDDPGQFSFLLFRKMVSSRHRCPIIHRFSHKACVGVKNGRLKAIKGALSLSWCHVHNVLFNIGFYFLIANNH